MAVLVLSDAHVEVNAVDLSSRVKQVTLNYGAEERDPTAMGDTTRKTKGGLKTWSIDVEFLQDFAAANVDATIFPIVGTDVVVLVRPTSAAVSATNPNFTGTGMIAQYNPFPGQSVGDMAMARLGVKAAGTLSRATV